MESLNQCRRSEVREMARKLMFFVMSLRLSDHKVLHNIASSSSFLLFRSDFLARISCFNFLKFKEFNKTIIPFTLVGYETGYSQLGATRLVAYSVNHLISNARSWNNYRLTHSASKLSGFTCTGSLTMIEKLISIPREAAECGIEKFRVHC